MNNSHSFIIISKAIPHLSPFPSSSSNTIYLPPHIRPFDQTPCHVYSHPTHTHTHTHTENEPREVTTHLKVNHRLPVALPSSTHTKLMLAMTIKGAMTRVHRLMKRSPIACASTAIRLTISPTVNVRREALERWMAYKGKSRHIYFYLQSYLV